MLCSKTRVAIAAVCVGFGAATGAAAQDGSAEPQVVASGMGEVVIPATKASFEVQVTSLAVSAAAASAESARIAKAVSGALQAARLTREEIAQSGLTVSPRWEYDQAAHRDKRIGYQATTTTRIETEHLDRLGTYIDAALNAGATEISDITFSAKDTDETRHRALTQAVARARADAEAMARAGGGTLGQLVLLTTEQQNVPLGVGFQEVSVTAARAARVPTSIIPSQIEVTARIIGRWRFVPNAAPR
jgi:uncharacterized protein